MKAVRIHAHGGPECLVIEEIPDAGPGPGQVLVAVHAVGVNHLDTWVRRGVPGHRFPLPIIPGSDVAGVVEAVGADVRVRVGQPVALHPGVGCGSCAPCLQGHHDLCRSYGIRGESWDGGCAERVVVDERELLPLPEGHSMEEAAATPLALLTAWHMLVGRVGIRPGQVILVQAAGSGVGTMAVQIGRLWGCTVLATASTEAKRAALRELGAHQAFGYDEIRPRIKALVPGGVDVVVDHVGQVTWAESIRALRRGGSLVTCGATSGGHAEIDLRVLFFKQLSLLGSTMGSMGEMTEAWNHYLSGRIRPVIHAVLPMSRTGEAHRILEDREVFGKVVLRQDLEA